MTTIAQLPPASSAGAGGLLPLSQGGVLYSVSVAQLTANLQPLISVPTGELLGRNSMGAGGPESVTVGMGLALSTGTLSATGADHAGFPVQGTLALSDDVVISAAGAPGLLPVTALRGLFTAGSGVAISSGGVISVTVSAIAGPQGPQGATGPQGPQGPAGATGATGAGLTGPAAATATSTVGASDYVALWQNGALAWMPYGEFLGGETINQLPAAGPAADSDQLMVAQGGNSLSVQSFGAIWSYVQGKLPSVQDGVVELTTNTVLDATQHNNRVLIASAPLTLTANFANMGAGFGCTLVNLAAGNVVMGTGISSGSGGTVLPPGAMATLLGLSYSGGSLVWWSGVVPDAPTLTVETIVAPAPGTGFVVTGGVFNDAPSALDYSTDGGATWHAAASPVISTTAYSFTVPGLVAGTYTVRVRDHNNTAIVGVSNGFTILAPTVALGTVPASVTTGVALALTGTVSPAGAAVQIGLSNSASAPPGVWANATVSGGVWAGSLTPGSTGTWYVWAQQQGDTAVTAVSGAVNVVTAALSVSAPSSGTAGVALSVSGSVSPVSDAVNMVLDVQNGTAPSTGWVAATNTAGALSASLTPAAAGTYYAWAKDTATGLTAVSAAIAVAAAPALVFGFNNPGGAYVHGVSTIPLNGAITPAQAVATQVALSTSNTVVPSAGWESAAVIYGNALWAIYYNTPAVAGSYYVWVQTAAGEDSAVSSFTVTVT
jgi:hypothetical protein